MLSNPYRRYDPPPPAPWWERALLFAARYLKSLVLGGACSGIGFLAACHTLTPTQVTEVNAVVAAGCALAEAVPLPDALKPFAPLEPVACAGLEAELAAALTKLSPSADAGAGVAAAALTAGPKAPYRPVLAGGRVVGLARVQGAL